MHRGQTAALWSWFSPFTFMWVYGCSYSIACTTNASIFWAISLTLSTLFFWDRVLLIWLIWFSWAERPGRSKDQPVSTSPVLGSQAIVAGTWICYMGPRDKKSVVHVCTTIYQLNHLPASDWGFLNTAESPKQIPICYLNPPSVWHFVIITFENQHRKNMEGREKRFLDRENLKCTSLTALEMDWQHSTTTHICEAQLKAGHVPNTNDTHI